MRTGPRRRLPTWRRSMAVTMRFPYQDEALGGASPPSLPAGATLRWRPLIPITIAGPPGRFHDFPRALLDTGADDTIFPFALAQQLGIALLPHKGHGVRWRGQLHPLRFGNVELALTDSV